MTNIVRTDPFQELSRFDPFRELEMFTPWTRFRRWVSELPAAEPLMKLDVTENDKSFNVKVDLPGVKKEDIGVEVEGNQVSITAETRKETEEKEGDTVIHTERYYGRQSRTFILSSEIDRNAVEAKFADGVLSLTLPKTEAAKVQRITIS